jgi:hypothetical protein
MSKELVDLTHQSGGEAGSLLQEAGAILQFGEDLTAEELIYLKVYQDKLQDAGFVMHDAPPSTPAPWHFRHKTQVLTQLRLIRWIAFFLCVAIGGGTGIFLLVTTVQVRVALPQGWECCKEFVLTSSVGSLVLLGTKTAAGLPEPSAAEHAGTRKRLWLVCASLCCVRCHFAACFLQPVGRRRAFRLCEQHF